jgi:hypothetical protein
MTRTTRLLAVLTVLSTILVVVPGSVSAQSLRHKMERIFDDSLRLQLGGSPGEHANHFNPDRVATSQQTIDQLTRFIGANISSFPLSSTSASVTFDLSSGVPVRKTSSLGPVYTDRASSIGKGRTILGYNFTFMRLNKVRGLDTQSLRFTFSHEDVGAPGLGDSDNELDTIDLFMNMELEASVLAFYFTHGVTKRLDLSLAIPIVNVRMRADPVAYMNSFTFVKNDSANHFFDGTRVDPVLFTIPQPIDDDATGVGDIALQAKYNFLRGGRLELTALLGARLATGDKDNFLGAGDPSYRVALVASGTREAGAPHLNLAYVFHQSELVRDQIDAFLAYDHKAGDRLTLAFELLGRFEVGERIQGSDAPNSVKISRPVSEGTFAREVDLSNLPDFDNDHRVSGGVGIKFAPRDFFVFIANVLVPLNDGGLRPDAIATLGFEFNF